MKNFFNILGLSIVLVTNIFGQSLPNDINEQQLRKQIGQMLIIGFGGYKQDAGGKVLWDDKDGVKFRANSIIAKHIAKNNIGGVILFTNPYRDIKTGEFIRDRNIQCPAQVAKLIKDLQGYNKQQQEKHRLEYLPIFIGVDQEGGRVDRLSTTLGFPVATFIPQSFGIKSDINETYSYAKKLAQEIANVGFNLNFSPVVDVDINPTNPIIGGLGRSFSANPKIVAEQASQFIKAFQENHIIPVLKHFPGHGSSLGDSHAGLVDVTKTCQKQKELYPYRKLIKDGYDGMVMTTHVINGQIDQTQCKAGNKNDAATWCPGTMSYVALTKLLRKQIGFKGIIISDDMTMGAITKEYSLSQSLKAAINAGVDIFIVANNCADQTDEVIDTIVRLVKNGEIEINKIEQAYQRITDFKKKHLL